MDAVATHVVFLRDVLAADRAHAFERERENGQRCQIRVLMPHPHANFSKLNFSVVGIPSDWSMRPPRGCVSTGPVVVRLAVRANERER